MNFGAILKCLVFLSLGSKIESTIKEDALALANSVKVLLQAIGSPGFLTVMTCWKSGCSHFTFELN